MDIKTSNSTDVNPKMSDMNVSEKSTNKEKCFICADKLYYKDNDGIWHSCPKCNSFNWNLNSWWFSDTSNSRFEPAVTIYPCAICGCTDGQHCLAAHTSHDSGNPITHVVCNCPKCRVVY